MASHIEFYDMQEFSELKIWIKKQYRDDQTVRELDYIKILEILSNSPDKFQGFINSNIIASITILKLKNSHITFGDLREMTKDNLEGFTPIIGIGEARAKFLYELFKAE